MDATDAMTSQTVEARYSYQAADIVLTGDQNKDMIRRLPNGQLSVDYTCFRERTEGAATIQEAVQDISEPEPALTAPSPRLSISPAATPTGSTPLARLRSTMQPSPSAGVAAAGAGAWDHGDLDASASAPGSSAAAKRAQSGGSAGASGDVVEVVAPPVQAARLRLQRFSVPPSMGAARPQAPTRPSPLHRRAHHRCSAVLLLGPS